MPPAPHDLADLRLAPVALALNERLDALAGLDRAELLARVTLETNKEPRTPEERAEALLDSVAHLLDLGGWGLSWHVRVLGCGTAATGWCSGSPRTRGTSWPDRANHPGTWGASSARSPSEIACPGFCGCWLPVNGRCSGQVTGCCSSVDPRGEDWSRLNPDHWTRVQGRTTVGGVDLYERIRLNSDDGLK